MRYWCLSVWCALATMLMACGGGSSSGTLTGNWAATLTNSDGETELTFNATLTQGSSSSITVANLVFTTATTCFDSGTTGTSTFSPSGTSSVAGTFQMTLQSSMKNTNGMNQLTLQGTSSSNTINGTWNLSGTGSGCKGSGDFSMIRM